MLTKDQIKGYRQQALDNFDKAGIVLTEIEKQGIEIADFGLGEYEQTGLAVLVYVNTERCCAKELAMLPRQTCPEHRHPNVGSSLGKEETFRCRWGKMYLYISGPAAAAPRPSPDPHQGSEPRGVAGEASGCRSARAMPPAGRAATYTAWHEIELNPGDQYTLQPNTLHWFQSGPEGAVVSEFSTHSTDENDVFTDPEIARITQVIG